MRRYIVAMMFSLAPLEWSVMHDCMTQECQPLRRLSVIINKCADARLYVMQICRVIDSLPEGSDILSRIFAGASVYYNYSGQAECFHPMILGMMTSE